MADKETRLREAEQVLHRMELRLEQVKIHVEGLTAHPELASKAGAVLEQMNVELARQRKYRNLLAAAQEALDLFEQRPPPPPQPQPDGQLNGALRALLFP